MGQFQDKVIVITGGNSGIGLACAQAFVGAGAKVAVLGRNKQTLAEAEERFGDSLLALAGDVTNNADLDRLYAETVATFGRVDCVVANAGVPCRLPMEEVTEAIFDKVFSINVKGLFFTAQRALPHLNDKASMIFVSSIAAHSAVANMSTYAGTKAAISQMTKNIAAELAPRGIRVNCISPGLIRTPIWDKAVANDPTIFERGGERVPLWQRFAEPEEIASVALFLASDAANYLTGQDLVVDGGVTELRQGIVHTDASD